MNDYYVSIHFVGSSVADAMVTDDGRLCRAITNLRTRGIPKVWSLETWAAEVERVY